MAEEFYTVPESPEYNAAAIRKIQDTDPVRASTCLLYTSYSYSADQRRGTMRGGG